MLLKASAESLGQRRAEGLTEQVAKNIIGEILERATGEPLPNHEAGEWLEQWLAAKEQVRARKTGLATGRQFEILTASLGNRANLALTRITPKNIFVYRKQFWTQAK